MLPQLSYKGKTIVYMADLLPSVAHIPVSYIMAYDTRPLQTLIEKKKFLSEAHQENYILFFEHDPQIECCTLQLTDRGVRSGESFNLSEL
jgi:hypothetical protein